MKNLFFGFFVFLFPFIGWSSTLLRTADGEEGYDLAQYFLILEDKSAALTLNEVLALEDSSFRFSGATAMGNADAVYWLKLGVENGSSLRWFYQMEDPDFERVQVYQNGKLVGESGMGYPFDFRPIAHKNFVFPLDIPLGEEVTLLVKVESPVLATFTSSLVSMDGFISYALGEYYFLGAFYG